MRDHYQVCHRPRSENVVLVAVVSTGAARLPPLAHKWGSWAGAVRWELGCTRVLPPRLEESQTGSGPMSTTCESRLLNFQALCKQVLTHRRHSTSNCMHIGLNRAVGTLGDASPLSGFSSAAACPPEVVRIGRICSITCVHRVSLPLCLVTSLAMVAAWTPSKPANLQIKPYPQRVSGSPCTSPRLRGLTGGTRRGAEGSQWALPV